MHRRIECVPRGTRSAIVQRRLPDGRVGSWLRVLLLIFVLLAAISAFGQQPAMPGPQAAGPSSNKREVRIKELATIEGVRDNALVGYGMVVGLNGTGDRRQTLFSTQTLANILQRMGVTVPPTAVRVNNIAAVFVTGKLPPFARPGTRLDVTVSSIGDAKSLEGGLLLLTPLYGADGQVYATAQGAVTLGGYSAGGRANSRQVNHPTVGRIPDAGVVERALAFDLQSNQSLALILRDSDFTVARDVAAMINQNQGREVARARDSRRIELLPGASSGSSIPGLLASIENLSVAVTPPARVVINERTGTVVMGKDVTLGAVSILHGSLSVEISTVFEVSQPAPFSPRGDTVTVPQTTLQAKEAPARTIELKEGATVEDLVRGLHAIGATARDIVAILQAMKSAGALHAELEVL